MCCFVSLRDWLHGECCLDYFVLIEINGIRDGELTAPSIGLLLYSRRIVGRACFEVPLVTAARLL